MSNSTNKPSLSVKEAKKILGTTATGLSDSAIMQLVEQVDALTDVVVAHVQDSKINSGLEKSNEYSHTGL